MNRYTETSESRTAFRAKSYIPCLRIIAVTENITTENTSAVSVGYDRPNDVVGVMV